MTSIAERTLLFSLINTALKIARLQFKKEKIER